MRRVTVDGASLVWTVPHRRAIRLGLAQRQRQVVQRRHPDGWVTQLFGQRQAALQVLLGLVGRALRPGQNAQQVMHLRQRAHVPGCLRQLQRFLRQRLRSRRVPPLVGRQAPVGVQAGAALGRRAVPLRVQRRLKVALGQRPLALPVVDTAQFVLQRPQRLGPAQRRGLLVAGQRRRV